VVKSFGGAIHMNLALEISKREVDQVRFDRANLIIQARVLELSGLLLELIDCATLI